VVLVITALGFSIPEVGDIWSVSRNIGNYLTAVTTIYSTTVVQTQVCCWQGFGQFALTCRPSLIGNCLTAELRRPGFYLLGYALNDIYRSFWGQRKGDTREERDAAATIVRSDKA